MEDALSPLHGRPLAGVELQHRLLGDEAHGRRRPKRGVELAQERVRRAANVPSKPKLARLQLDRSRARLGCCDSLLELPPRVELELLRGRGAHSGRAATPTAL
eukprot:3360429-Prymnesium_polylepis.1